MVAVSATAFLGLVSALLGLAVLLGGTIAVLFTQLKKNTNQIVRDENKDLRERLDTVESAEERCKVELAEVKATVKVLSDLATGASAVSELATTVAFNHDEILKRLDRLSRRRQA